MPNHVTSITTITGPRKSIEKFISDNIKEVPDEKRRDYDPTTTFDFNEVVPQPEEVFDSIYRPEPDEGFPPFWYRWRVANWGTKWNAYNLYLNDGNNVGSGDPDEIVDFMFTFCTAWSFPEPIFLALAEKYKDISFTARYADEDIGSNCGIFSTKWNHELGDIDTIFTDKEGDAKFACGVLEIDMDECDEESEEEPIPTEECENQQKLLP